MLNRPTRRFLLGAWAASLAYLAAPVSVADPVAELDRAGASSLDRATWGECNSEWKMRFCAPSDPSKADYEHRRVKPRDVLQSMADAILGEGFQLLNVGRNSGPSFLDRTVDTSPVRYYIVTDSNGVRLRVRTKNDGLSLSVRNSPNDYDDESLALKLGVELRW